MAAKQDTITIYHEIAIAHSIKDANLLCGKLIQNGLVAYSRPNVAFVQEDDLPTGTPVGWPRQAPARHVGVRERPLLVYIWVRGSNGQDRHVWGEHTILYQLLCPCSPGNGVLRPAVDTFYLCRIRYLHRLTMAVARQHFS